MPGPSSFAEPRLRVFALGESRASGLRIASLMGTALAPYEERRFEDGESKTRPLVSVRDHDVYIIESIHSDPTATVHDKLCRLAFFVGAVRDAAAGRITAVLPYLCYARKDARTKLRDPVTTRYVAMMLEAVGTDRVVTLDVHNPAAFENAFRCRTEHLEATRLFAGHFAPRLAGTDPVVVSPDAGGVKRANRLRLALEAALGRPVESGFMEKHRSEGVVTGDAVVGAVRGQPVIVIDDLISTGTTLARTARACRAAGATAVFAAATHGLFTGEAPRILLEAPIDQVVVTDTVPPFRLGSGTLGGRLVVLDTAPLLAGVIGRLHRGGSVAALAEEETTRG